MSPSERDVLESFESPDFDLLPSVRELLLSLDLLLSLSERGLLILSPSERGLLTLSASERELLTRSPLSSCEDLLRGLVTFSPLVFSLEDDLLFDEWPSLRGLFGLRCEEDSFAGDSDVGVCVAVS